MDERERAGEISPPVCETALADLSKRFKSEFERTRRVMSFSEYLELCQAAPQLQTRNSVNYLIDSIDHFGVERVARPWGECKRFKVFDAPFDNGRDRLIGQEDAQGDFYRVLTNFARERRVRGLILLHGPNGSAKSTFLSCLARGLEQYSRVESGALYSFRWIFPKLKAGKKRFGFSTGDGEAAPPGSYAHLDDEEVDVRLGNDLFDHPLLLLPEEQRAALFGGGVELGGGDRALPSEYVLRGDLSPRNRQIFDALLTAYDGDLARVLAHVQVERFFISTRYRRGAVTVEPQLQVDAGVRQVTADKSLDNLPASLHNTVLYEPFGDLVDANRGIIEYNDLLKRPIEAFKYLLATCEKGTVALPNCILFLDLVFVGSSNEKHLRAFKKHPDFASFKGRIELVRLPYLRSFTVEAEIYRDQLRDARLDKHVAPHSERVAAMWAVMTRLFRPDASAYPESVREVVANLSARDKALLFGEGRKPSGTGQEGRGATRQLIRNLYQESEGEEDYEGCVGASPREIKTILFNSVQDESYRCLSPAGILAELKELIKDPSVYEFLALNSDEGYFEPERFIDDVRVYYLGLVDEELREAMGLVGESQYLDLFKRYVTHVSHSLKRERMFNPATGAYEDPDHKFMAEMEEVFGASKSDQSDNSFRRRLIGAIGAFRVENPDADVDYQEIFPKLFDALRRSYFERQKETVERSLDQLLTYLQDNKGGLSDADRTRAEGCYEILRDRYGYCRSCAEEALRLLQSHRRAPARSA